MKLFTIGFTKKSAEEFFKCLHKAGVYRVVDIRLNNLPLEIINDGGLLEHIEKSKK